MCEMYKLFIQQYSQQPNVSVTLTKWPFLFRAFESSIPLIRLLLIIDATSSFSSSTKISQAENDTNNCEIHVDTGAMSAIKGKFVYLI